MTDAPTPESLRKEANELLHHAYKLRCEAFKTEQRAHTLMFRASMREFEEKVKEISDDT